MEDIEDLGKAEGTLQPRQKTNYAVKIHLNKAKKTPKIL